MKYMLVVLALGLSACSQAVPPSHLQQPQSYVDPGHIEIRTGIPWTVTYKFYDKEDNVVCYVIRKDNGISMDCLPYNDEGTHLQVVEEVPQRQYGDE